MKNIRKQIHLLWVATKGELTPRKIFEDFKTAFVVFMVLLWIYFLLEK